jgi:hypothetical protein
MATFDLLPTGTTGTNNWTCSTGSDFVDIVDEDDDSTYIYETFVNGEINYTFANPSVPSVDIDFSQDVTVTAYVHAHYTYAVLGINMTIHTNGTGIAIPTTTVSVNNSAYPTYTGPSSTNMNLGTSWTYAGLENIQMKLICAARPARFEQLRVSYIFFRVVYTPTEKGVFFGANF